MQKFAFILVASLLFSCAKKESIFNDFLCGKTLNEGQFEITTDFNKTFAVSSPKTWKTQLYYDNYQSAIMLADTTTSATKSFIYDSSYNFGELTIDEAFGKAMDVKASEENNLKVQKTGFSKFGKKPLYWHVLEGKKANRDYTMMKIYVKTGEASYLMTDISVYGNENVEKRLCQALEIFKTTQFLN